MAGRGRGYIPSLRGCLGWGQDQDRERNRDGFGFYGDRYQNTPFDGQIRPFVDPQHRDPTGYRRVPDGVIPPSRRGGPNERYLSEADSRYHYYEDEGFWDQQGDYHFMVQMGYLDNDGEFNILNSLAERFGLGYFEADGEFYFYEDEIERVDLMRLLDNIERAREGTTEHVEEQNVHATNVHVVADSTTAINVHAVVDSTTEHEEEKVRADRIRDEGENVSAYNSRYEEETDPMDEYYRFEEETDPMDEYYRDGGEEKLDCAENSDRNDQMNGHDMEMDFFDDGDEEEEEVLKLPFIFPSISKLKKLDAKEEKEQFSAPSSSKNAGMIYEFEKLDAKEETEQFFTPCPSQNAGPLYTRAGYTYAPPYDQMHVVRNKLESGSDRANSTPRNQSKDFRVLSGSSLSSIARPDGPGLKLHKNKMSGLAWRPTVSSSLKQSGSFPNSFGSVRASLPPGCSGKPGTNRTRRPSQVSLAGKPNRRLAHLPARYRAAMTGDPFVDDVVAQEMLDWAREEEEEAKAKNRIMKATGAKARRL